MQIRNHLMLIVAVTLLIAACGPATPAAPPRATAQPVPPVGTVFTGTGPMHTPPFAASGRTTVFRFEHQGDDPYRVVLNLPGGEPLILFDGKGAGASVMTQEIAAGEYTLDMTTNAKWTLTVSEK